MFLEIHVFSNQNALGRRRQLANARTAGGNLPFLTMQKDGKWVWGAEENDVKDSDRWVVNPDSISLGFIAWAGGQVVGEQMASLVDPTPIDQGNLPPVEGDGWQPQVAVQLKNPVTDTEVIFKTSSQGGREAVSVLCTALVEQAATNPAAPLPVVRLTNDSYKHKDYGKIYKPVFDIVDWTDADSAGKAAKEPTGKRKALV